MSEIGKPSQAYTNAIACFKDKLLENKHCLQHLKIDLLTLFPYDQAVKQNSKIRTLAHEVEEELNYELSEFQCSTALVQALREMKVKLEGDGD